METKWIHAGQFSLAQPQGGGWICTNGLPPSLQILEGSCAIDLISMDIVQLRGFSPQSCDCSRHEALVESIKSHCPFKPSTYTPTEFPSVIRE
jgi:hypothetical protein